MANELNDLNAAVTAMTTAVTGATTEMQTLAAEIVSLTCRMPDYRLPSEVLPTLADKKNHTIDWLLSA
jgi:hypothetical protein